VEQKNNRKGFLFVVTVFLVLTYILLSISVWVKSIEASERSYSEFYKESNVELAMEQITSEKLDKVSSIILNRGLYVLNNHSVTHPIKRGSSDEFQYVNAAFSQWLANGSPDASNFEYGVAPSEYKSSLAAWAENLNGSLSSIGVYIQEFNVSKFSIYQTDIDVLNYSFNVDLRMADKSGTTSVVRTYAINNSMNISGLPDPAIARESGGQIPGRRFYFQKELYADNTTLRAKTIFTGNSNSSGQGWFYGYLTNVSDAGSVRETERLSYIMVGTYDEIVASPYYKNFSAFIVTSPPEHTRSCNKTDGSFGGWNEEKTFNALEFDSDHDCEVSVNPAKGEITTYPFVVAPNFSIDSAGRCPDIANLGNESRRCALFVTAYNNGDSPLDKKLSHSRIRIYDIEPLRDFTLCGYYIGDPNAPSYLQRLFNNSYSYNNSLGISTFLIGRYVNISIADSYSRLDREMFMNISGSEVRGMPGCKDPFRCTDPERDIGRFRLSIATLTNFGLEELGCEYNPSLARCK